MIGPDTNAAAAPINRKSGRRRRRALVIAKGAPTGKALMNCGNHRHHAASIIDSNDVLTVCPQPGSTMSTSYNALVNTAQVHIFTVAQLNYMDSRWSQPTTHRLS
jgi:hypothetical protein